MEPSPERRAPKRSGITPPAHAIRNPDQGGGYAAKLETKRAAAERKAAGPGVLKVEARGRSNKVKPLPQERHKAAPQQR